MRARGFFLCLALGLAGWVVFLGVAMATRLDVGIERVFAAHYDEAYRALMLYLMALTPFLIGASMFYVWRGELSATGSTVLLLAFLGGSFLLLRLFSPYFAAVFPG